MLKWIASGCLVVILVVCVVAYAGYRKMQSIAADGPTVTVGIKATPERVFASMSHTDSLRHWFASGLTIRPTRAGKLAAGDTLLLITRRDSVPRTAWVVDTIVPNQLLVLHWAVLENRMVLHRRRDSLSASGDSTIITSTVIAAMTDSLAAARSKASGVTGGMIDMASTMGTAGARIQAERELKILKLRIERPGAAVPRP
jgi:uncharacterized protein YndB with AHSA1/START domain